METNLKKSRYFKLYQKKMSSKEKRDRESIVRFISRRPGIKSVEQIAEGTGFKADYIKRLLNYKKDRFSRLLDGFEEDHDQSKSSFNDFETDIDNQYYDQEIDDDIDGQDYDQETTNEIIDSQEDYNDDDFSYDIWEEFDPDTLTKDNNISDFKGFVIDSCIAGVKNPQSLLEKIISSGYRVILLDVVITTLHDMESKETTRLAKKVRAITKMAAKDEEGFLCEKAKTGEEEINKISSNEEDNYILNYCAKNKGNIVLLTGDKEMTLLARTEGIKVFYFEPTDKMISNFTLHNVQKDEFGKFIFMPYITMDSAVFVVSKGRLQKFNNPCELCINDDVYILSSSESGVIFRHYRFDKLSTEKNLALVKKAFIANRGEINYLSKQSYIRIANVFFEGKVRERDNSYISIY